MIFITGDTHGIESCGRYSVDGASKRLNVKNFPEQKEMDRNDYVIICGDSGFVWDYDSRYNNEEGVIRKVIGLEHGESKQEKYWLDWLSKKPFTVLFCDGNHENYDRLDRAYPEVDYLGGRAHKIRDNVYHLMRGYVFDIDGKSFFVFGGAKSHDVDDGIIYPTEYKSKEELKREIRGLRKRKARFRVNHVSWWKREMPDEEEMNRGVKNLEKRGNDVDFIITHCAPLQVAALMGYTDRNKCTVYLNTVAETVRFRRWFFGHYHTNRQILGKFICTYEQVIRIN